MTKARMTMTNNKLTKREKQFLELACKEGLSLQQIAEKMNVGKTTVATFKTDVYSKTDTHNMAQLMFKYYNNLLEGI